MIAVPAGIRRVIEMQPYVSEAFLQQVAQTFAAWHHAYWNDQDDFGMPFRESGPASSGADEEWHWGR
jgi:hypothetical protein